jgi:O-antigen/teichoic acid export membrane protein
MPTSTLVARHLGAEGQDAYASAIVFPTLFAFVGLLGIDASHTFFLSKKRYSLSEIGRQ